MILADLLGVSPLPQSNSETFGPPFFFRYSSICLLVWIFSPDGAVKTTSYFVGVPDFGKKTFLVQPDGAGRSNQTGSSDAPASLTAAEPSFSTELAIFTCQFPPKNSNRTTIRELIIIIMMIINLTILYN
ncbi:hypothetical protein MtrunA17_Chr6g0476231 [Medicago truncatula]|uniref:Uncharacterized protein n=1 Tax=Medicago truncatula TaxID=3880 RepID=A0A396HMH2_MEDTR|nr:hypothetical protein MtrunA17_Chr6g0476231 [Medicago truncatula]